MAGYIGWMNKKNTHISTDDSILVLYVKWIEHQIWKKGQNSVFEIYCMRKYEKKIGHESRINLAKFNEGD